MSTAQKRSIRIIGSSIEVHVRIGPMCVMVFKLERDVPTSRIGPLYGLKPNGQEVMRFETDKDGPFRVAFPPGKYILHPD